MEPRDLTLTDQTPAPPAVALPYEGLEKIWELFPDARPGAGGLPAPTPHTAVGLPTDEAYMARVYDLVRREEALNHIRAQYQQAAAHVALAPAPVYPQIVAQTPAPALPPAPAPEPQRAVPAYVWKYSALTLSTGGCIALTGVGIGAAAPTLAQIPAILTATGQVLMSGTVLVVVVLLLLALRGTGGGGGRGGNTFNIRKAVFRRNTFRG
ncbi:hypothetical protein STTU_p0129 (plasmid) [Streptomyces sp. Tu6071]|uniref:hypothetical protein n=1 Tax=Streptomyces sp. Tu6071 TaxID=355249 RepID=UPI00020E6B53|nr:hypothetical protein [Streptomyces sp. Tu6071]EGJ72742.1 hypothetical protein STTU_p0129 [Streptomyces sp. Tu6071]